MVARNCNTGRRFRGAERYVGMLHELSTWMTPAEVAERVGNPDVDAVHRALERLAGMDLVVTDKIDDADDSNGQPPAGTSWNLIDLALQRQGALGGYDPDTPRPGTPPPAFKPLPATTPVPLPSGSLDGACSLGDTLERRRSVRTYTDAELPLDDLAAFLQAAARVKRRLRDAVVGELTLRPSPSGGARHPLEIYPVCNAVAGLDPGAYYYQPMRHELYPVRPADSTQAALNRQVNAATGNALNRDPPVVLLITAVFQRTMWKYDEIGLSLILKDVGALYQTMYLVATGLGLAPCAIGGGREADNARWLGLDPLVESQVGCFLLGRPGDPPVS